MIDRALPRFERPGQESFSVPRVHRAHPSPDSMCIGICDLRIRSGRRSLHNREWRTRNGDSEVAATFLETAPGLRPARLNDSNRGQAQRRARTQAPSLIQPCRGRPNTPWQFDPVRAEVEQSAADRGPRPRGGLTLAYYIAAFQAAGWAPTFRIEVAHMNSHHAILLMSTHCRSQPRGAAV